MTVLQSPADRFEGLEGWHWGARYTEVDGHDLGPLRIAHAEDGPADGPVVLLMHGEPSWAYLYRHMIPPLAAAGCRVLAPDLVGFGRSDKPVERSAYSYAAHVGWMLDWFDRQAISGVTLFCQDWGGLIGLRLVAARPDRFARVVAANTFLPTGTGASEGFLRWQAFSQKMDPFDSGWIINSGTARGISDGARAAYNAPFPDESYMAGARQFPLLVPTDPEDPGAIANREAWGVLEQFDKPFLTLFGDSDPVTAGADGPLQARIPGARGQPHRTIERAGHFLQEDARMELAAAVLAFMGRA